jgi:hypothetical protein
LLKDKEKDMDGEKLTPDGMEARERIATITEDIEKNEKQLADHPRGPAMPGSITLSDLAERMLALGYFQRAYYRHILSKEVGKAEKKSLLASARQDIDKALSYPDRYFPDGKGSLLLVQEAIKKDSGGCFIATAAYGSAAMPEVTLLRQFRDERLRRSQPGRLIIRLYEWASPPLADWIAARPAARLWARRLVLAPMVRLARRWTSF